MLRREFSSSALVVLYTVLGAFSPTGAWALSLSDVSAADAAADIKAALEKAGSFAIDSLGQENGFMNNPEVRIGLPGHLEDAAGLLRKMGQARQIDELVATMNHAAEQAVPLARKLIHDAVGSMTVTDAKGILTGGATSVTDFFARKTRSELAAKFLPIVSQVTDKLALTEKYNQVASKVSSFGLVKKEDANVQTYVTGKAVDGLYQVIGEKEQEFRRNPISAGTGVAEKVFGALRP
jgi:hypothetical protein